jgi:thiol-disulfide isomerase/thioredoxin
MRIAVQALGLLSLLVLPCAARAQELPRYKLQVGQELTYKGKGEFKHENGKFIYQSNYTIHVTRANADGSWRLVIRFGSTFSQDDGKPEKEDVSYAYCDLFPEGRMVENDTFGYRMKPRQVLPLLPQEAGDLRTGWLSRDARMDETTRYRLPPAGIKPDRLMFEATRESPMNQIYGFEFNDVATFDLRRGLVERVDVEDKQTYGFKGQGHSLITLDNVRTLDREECQRFVEDSDRYFAALKEYKAATEGRNRKREEIKAGLAKGKEILEATRKELKLPVWQGQIDHQLSSHEQTGKYLLEEAERTAELLGKPGADFATTDFQGGKHALKDYRGKVVILDFWYRGCGWCIRAMPQVKEVAAHYKDQPVVVFGMNTDGKEEDARFVIDKMGLNYPNLKAEGLPGKYKVQGFPTLLILDQEGVLRDIHVGYSPTLKEEIIKSVDQLLGKGKP